MYQVRVITVFTVFRLLTDFVCLYNYAFWLSLCKIVRSSVLLLLPLFRMGGDRCDTNSVYMSTSNELNISFLGRRNRFQRNHSSNFEMYLVLYCFLCSEFFYIVLHIFVKTYWKHSNMTIFWLYILSLFYFQIQNRMI